MILSHHIFINVLDGIDIISTQHISNLIELLKYS